MAYTYGSYIFTTIDASGNKQESRGKFHTVWKKQADGSWKFVYD
jgi:ketosteroid isomerase-like protein